MTRLPPLDLIRLSRAYREGSLDPVALIEALLADIAARGDDHVWLSLVPKESLLARAKALRARGPADLPLYGIPFAVKDNIDLAECPTTAACPAYSYLPEKSAAAVRRLEAAGAIAIGKTNLDQFATGLVGVRSPYGVPRNPFDPALLPGGSSSGSAVAVAQGQVSFALGTDTAGSGRVPAGFNNIVGLKPTRGLISCTGVVPACRSLDCVSIFALTAGDAAFVLAHAAGPDASDAFSRSGPAFGPPAAIQTFRFGVPLPHQRQFFGDAGYPKAFEAALTELEAIGGRPVPIDLEPFLETARLLYDGPWVAERWAAVGDFVGSRPNDVHPVTRRIIEAGRDKTAADAFKGFYRLETLRRQTAPLWRDIDLMVVPTAGRHYTVAEVEADPIALNSNLGLYTNFVNLLDLCALALPARMITEARPFGITLIAPAFKDHFLASLGVRWQSACNPSLGATGYGLPDHPAPQATPTGIEMVVVGAHLSGQPLNHQLADRGARLLRATRTAPCYRLFALPGGPPDRPGLLKVAEGGGAIEVEVWDLPAETVGGFIAGVPAPLSIGHVQLEDGTAPLGFLCESAGTAGARDITALGGWRAYLREKNAS